MKKFCATIIALFCLFNLCVARTASENDEVTNPISLPISENSATLRHPIEQVNTETESNSAVVPTVALTKVSFRPVNRHFDVRSKHPCRHGFKVFRATRGHMEIPYGNDMLVASGENSDFEEPVVHGDGRRIPGRWVRLHHHHHHHHDDEDSDSDSDSDDDEGDDWIKNFVFKKMRKHFGHQNGEEEKTNKDGFMKRVRKFFDHYFDF